MRRTGIALLLLLAAALTAAACGDDTPSDPVVARVDGRAVRQSDVDAVRAEARFNGDEGADALLGAVDRELLRQEADRLGVQVAPGAVEDRTRSLSERLGGDQALNEALARSRVSREQLREGLAAGLLAEAVQDARYPGLVAGDAAVRAFYKRHLGDLFTEPGAVELGGIYVRNEGIAGNALERLRQGQPFESVARQFSIDPESKNAGGRLGWVRTDSLPGDLAAAAGELDVGAVSKPVQGMGGWWVLKVFDRRAERILPLSDVRDDLGELLTRRRRAAALERWLERERDDGGVEYLRERE
jgi:parvulin-like peptidyl-prolyl isomerase